MTHLIIPDIHEEHSRIRRIMLYNKADRYVFLGDWFDSFTRSEITTLETCHLLNEIGRRDDVVLVFGNHDIHYRWPRVPGIHSSGYWPTSQQIIDRYVDPSVWDKFRFFTGIGKWLQGGWLVSHAGFAETLLDEDWPQQIEQEVLDALESGRKHRWLQAGMARGGNGIGGPVWLDWNYEFEPIGGINQVVGHTPDRAVRAHCIVGSKNYCIDTNLRMGMRITDGKEEIVRL